MAEAPTTSRIRALQAVMAFVALATVIGTVVLWPRGDAPELGATGADLDLVSATVTAVETVACYDTLEGVDADCQRVRFEQTAGKAAAASVPRTFLKSLIDSRTPTFEVGDRVVLSVNPLAPDEYRYTFIEFQRGTPLVVLAVAFIAAVVAFGRWQGLRALAGLCVSLAVVLVFLLPSLLRDNNALATALVATALIAYCALYLTHGVTMTTTVALAGTLTSVALIAVLAAIFTGLAEITGLSDSNLAVLSVTAEAIDPRAVLVAGIVIGALGVLDDVTITQVSAVAELRNASPTMAKRDLYASAIRIGRDHVASTVNTLALAYVGAALSMMLFFHQEGRGIGRILGSEVVAVELIRMLVGSIGLIVSVPVTTALAVFVADSNRLTASHSHGHGHSSGGANHGQGPSDSDGAPSWDDFAPGDELR
ncbi:MAG: YibE/F family protein [Actinobacteria bacterium]|nr:YibE/F family protein [Actinomycetota bacterium]